MVNRKSGSRLESPAEILSIVAKLDAEISDRRKAYMAFVGNIAPLPSHERAVAWLEYVSRLNESYSEHEAFVYLRSRGSPCIPQLKAVKKFWELGVKTTMQMCAAGASITDSKGTTRTIGRRAIAEASRVESLSPWVLRDFWWGHDRQEFSLEATMIRTAEWGPIRGFDAWWRRLAKTDMEAVMQGGVERIPASYWLFNMCRSRLALQFLEKSMRRRLEALELPGEDKDPWRFYHSLPTNRLRIVMHAEYLAHLIFCSIQMRGPTGKSPLVRRAAKELVRLQRATGGWPCWESDKQPGVEATAKAVHALCLAKPVGWKSAIERARKWLLKQQDRHGCWYDRGAPDATYLTVLVLDALALIDGKACTFAVQYNRANQEPRFEVAFSFPGADRKLIKNLANRMTKQYPKKKIFYDEYHQAELARPNLDTHLQRIYHQKARLNVVLLSSAYNEREWCGVEWRAIRDLINKKREEQVMFIKRGSPRVPGVFSLDGYISADDYSPNKIAEFIHQRIQSLKAPVSPS